MSSAKFVDEKGEKHQVEILGAGQQFVAYGVHPETGKPYQWTDAYGGPIAIPAAGLPPCSVERAKEIIRATEEYCRAKGWKVEEQGKEAGAAAPMSEFDMVVAESQKPDVNLEEAKSTWICSRQATSMTAAAGLRRVWLCISILTAQSRPISYGTPGAQSRQSTKARKKQSISGADSERSVSVR